MLLQDILDRGYLQVGFNEINLQNGVYTGITADLAKVLAAAIFADVSKVEYTLVDNFEQISQQLEQKNLDLVSWGATHNLSRDSLFSLDFAPTYFYDYQTVLVRNDGNIETIFDLEGKTIGVPDNTTAVDNLQPFLNLQGIEFTQVIYPSFEEMFLAYNQGLIDAVSTDRSILYNEISNLSDPDNHTILDTEFSQEPLALVLPENESQWSDLVRWSFYTLVQAEEYGINSTNIDTFLDSTTDPAIRRFLGLDGNLGQSLGLPADFTVQIIKQVGNYGEIYDQNFPTLPRDRNNLYYNSGLLYSLPFGGEIYTEFTPIDNDNRNLLQEIKQRGFLQVGMDENNLNFTAEQPEQWRSFELDITRAIAAAIFGDSSKIEFIKQDFNETFENVANGVVDISAMGITHNLVRDAVLGVDFSSPFFYSGLGFLVEKDSGINFISDLNGRTIGIEKNSTAEENIRDYFTQNNYSFIPQYFDNLTELFANYDSGVVDTIAIDQIILADNLRNLSAPNNHKILPDVISKEPLALVIDENQSAFSDVVNWTIYSLIQAEYLGINSQNIEDLIIINTDLDPNNDSNYNIRNFLGLEGDIGTGLEIPNDFTINIIKSVGNYGEIYDRNFDTTILPRNDNLLYTDFGLQYSPPLGDFSTSENSNEKHIFGGTNIDEIDLSPSTSPQLVFAGSGNDRIHATVSSSISSRIYGGSGNDELIAGTNDRLFGGHGDDTLSISNDGTGNSLFGGQGNDILIISNSGDNLLAGGQGNDQFWIAKDELANNITPNIILDFEKDLDIIAISNSLNININEIKLIASNSDTIISIGDNNPLAKVLGINPELLTISNDQELNITFY